MRVRVFLRQQLFTLPGTEHVPSAAVILEGTLGEATQLGAVIAVEAFFDDRGRALEAKPVRLVVPAGKIDHVLVLE